MKKTTVLGFGNPVREDDGVGVYVVQRLQEAVGQQPGLQIIDMGTSAFEVLFQLKGQDRVIVVDSVKNVDAPVGTLYKVPEEEILRHVQEQDHIYTHSLKWDQALYYARKMLGDAYPQQVDVYLIAIRNTRFNTEMTEEARRGGDRLVKILTDELKNT